MSKTLRVLPPQSERETPITLQELYDESIGLTWQWLATAKHSVLVLTALNFDEPHPAEIKDLEWAVLHVLYFVLKTTKFGPLLDFHIPDTSGIPLATVILNTNRRYLSKYRSQRAQFDDNNVTDKDIEILYHNFCYTGICTIGNEVRESINDIAQMIQDNNDRLSRLGRTRRILAVLMNRPGDVDMASLGKYIPAAKRVLCREMEADVEILVELMKRMNPAIDEEALNLRSLVVGFSDLDEVYRVCVLREADDTMSSQKESEAISD